ncbi:MAG: hypothetical protein ABEJ70_06770 [Halobacteriaceae archaeon]
MNRRQVLGALATGAAASLAGCSGAAGAVAPPVLPTDELEAGGWEQTDSEEGTIFRERIGPIRVVGTHHTLSFEDVALRRSVREKTLGAIDSTLAMLSATHVDFSPDLNNLPANVGRKEVLEATEDAARDQFVAQMEDAGLADVQQTGTGTMAVDTGETASTTTYGATFPVEDFGFDVAEGARVTVPGGAVAVEGLLAVWNHGDYVLVAGGAAPAESFERHVTEDLSDAITVTVDVELGLTPDAYREEIRRIVQGVR